MRLRPTLPTSVRVFVRDWLSSNNILLKGRDGDVLVDTGYGRHAPLLLELLASHQGLSGSPLLAIVNTHCHSDHMGGNAAVQKRYKCRIVLPEGEAPQVQAWDETALLLRHADQRAPRFGFDATIKPGAVTHWGDLDWHALAAPGHAQAALVFHNQEHGILISGDALWANGYGFVLPKEMDAAALPAARATLDMIASLGVRTVIPGHGEPFTEVGAALERAYARTEAFERDSLRAARHALKVFLMFALLDRQRFALAELPEYVASVPIYGAFNSRYLRLAPAALAQWLASELLRSGAARSDGTWLSPAGAPASASDSAWSAG